MCKAIMLKTSMLGGKIIVEKKIHAIIHVIHSSMILPWISKKCAKMLVVTRLTTKQTKQRARKEVKVVVHE